LSYWFPKKSRVNQLSRLLVGFETAARLDLSDAPKHISYLSEKLSEAQHHGDFPKAQIIRWLWLASQYRLYATTDVVIASRAASALQFLSTTVEKPSLSSADIQDLNWVLEATVAAIAPFVGSTDLRACLSERELVQIDTYIATFDDGDPFNRAAIELLIEPKLRLLATFSGIEDLISIQAKTSALLDAAERAGIEYAPARAALHYLADEDDVVVDRSGVVGLVDDIYVVEWAYAAVESQTRCLPLLEEMLRRWPFVGTATIGNSENNLDRYAQYVCCAGLFALFVQKSGLLVVRENGPFPILAAVVASLEAARLQAGNFATELTLWKNGDPITISDGTTTFNAVFGGLIRVGENTRYKVCVGQSGSITVGEEVLPYLSRSAREHKRLSRGQDILHWLKDRNVDNLVHLTGAGRRRPERHEAILLVGPRWKLDEYLHLITPLDTAPPALLGTRWVDSHGDATDWRGSVTDRPLLYTCADAATASELLTDPPAHISSWRVIVDGARLGRNLNAILSTTGKLDNISICVFAELHDRESTRALDEQGTMFTWYLEDQDVQVPPRAHLPVKTGSDPLERFLGRQSNHWVANHSFHAETDDFLEAVAEILESMPKPADGDLAIQSLHFSVTSFLRRAIGIPLVDRAQDDLEMTRLTQSIVAQSSILSAYDEGARHLRELFGRFQADSVKLSDRRSALERIAQGARSGEKMAVVCRSIPIADRCRDQSLNDPALARYDWLTLDALRRCAPYNRVVIPGWVNRETMREVASNGYGATTDLILLPFERRWYDKTLSAARRWERQLEQGASQFLKSVFDSEFASPPVLWREQFQLRHTPPKSQQNAQDMDDDTPVEYVEARALEALIAALPKGDESQQHAMAQLVLFEQQGSYALLPPNGQVIVLRTGDADHVLANAGVGGEKQLLVNVSALQPGMLLALPETTDRDLIDARADQLLVNAGSVRDTADRWKQALRRHFEAGRDTYVSFSRKIGEAGQSRDPFTIKSWATDTRSIAPRSFRIVVPLLARLTQDPQLTEGVDETISAIDQIYRARTRAAELLIEQIFSGEIDLSAPRLEISVSDHRLCFGLYKVERCAGIRDVPVDFIGRIRNFTDLQNMAFSE